MKSHFPSTLVATSLVAALFDRSLPKEEPPPTGVTIVPDPRDAAPLALDWTSGSANWESAYLQHMTRTLFSGRYAVPAKPSNVVIPDHSQQRIEAAEAKRLRKAQRKQNH